MSAVRSGTCVIPKSVFETAPAAAPSGSGAVKRVKRIDGTWAELPTLGADNPNFQARQAWPGGNIVTSNKDEALLKYYLRKKLPLPEHLQKLKDELGAAAMPSRDLRAQSSQKKKKGGGGADGNTRNWAKGGRLNWKKRWVVVTTTQFVSWYANEKCDELKGSMALHGAQVVASKKAGGFWILTNTRSLELVADSAPIAESWVRVLQDTANQVPQQVQVQPGPEVRRTPSSRAVDSERESGSWDIDANGESDLEDGSAPLCPGQADQPARGRAMHDYVAAE